MLDSNNLIEYILKKYLLKPQGNNSAQPGTKLCPIEEKVENSLERGRGNGRELKPSNVIAIPKWKTLKSVPRYTKEEKRTETTSGVISAELRVEAQLALM